MNLKHFRLYAPEPDTAGSGPTPEERGDLLEDDALAQAAQTGMDSLVSTNIKDDPAVKALEDDLTSKEDSPKKDSRIPLARHKEILEKEREQRASLERQLAQYQKGNELADMNAELTAAENNIMKLEKEYASLLTDGEIDKATALMAQIRKTEREMAEAKSDMKIHAAEVRATERARYNTAIERVEAAFPELNPDSDEYNETSAAEVLDLLEAYKSRGMTPTAALQKAVKMIVEPRTARQENAVTATPRVSDKDVAAERKQDAIAKTLKATSKTPASLGRAGVNSDRLGGGELDARAVMNMSQKEFAALSDAQIKKMRGDEL